MRCWEKSKVRLSDYQPRWEKFLEEVLNGLQRPQKETAPKYFYDEQGSLLYERICALEEYYIPRTENSILDGNIEEIVELLGKNVLLIEYGSGDCSKTHILLDKMKDLAAYVPVDISREQLMLVAGELNSAYPSLEVLPVCADYTTSFEIPVPRRTSNRVVVYFPGSTIGNFDPIPAVEFLKYIAGVCGYGGALLIGVDLKKDASVLHRAYNDRQGVTASFNLNLLERINREIGGDFKTDSFQHYAFYNPGEGRVEMHLVSLKEQTVHLNNVAIHFFKGESIHTENSYKFTIDEFGSMAATAGFRVERVWTDPQHWFSIQYLVSMVGE